MEDMNLLYMLEHIILPQDCWEIPGPFLATMNSTSAEPAYQKCKLIFEASGKPMPYQREEFSAKWHALPFDGCYGILRINFPEPKEDCDCYYSYVLFTRELDKIMYFCFEKTNPPFIEIPDGMAVLGRWFPDGHRVNYGVINDEDVLGMCIQIFQNGTMNS